MGNEVKQTNKVEVVTPVEMTAEKQAEIKRQETQKLIDKFLSLRASKQDLNVLDALRVIDPDDAESFAKGLMKTYLQKADWSGSARKGLLATIAKCKQAIVEIKANTMTARGLLLLYAGKWFESTEKRVAFIQSQIEDLKVNRDHVVDNIQADIEDYTAKVKEIDEVSVLRKALSIVTK